MSEKKEILIIIHDFIDISILLKHRKCINNIFKDDYGYVMKN